MSHPVEKVRSTGNERVFLTERGSCFGYNTLVVDYRALPVMRALAPVVFDAHTFRAAALGGQRRQRRPAGVHPVAGARRRRRWHRRALS
jgi:3-deoxy-D-manno-octulosonic acid (KDO) 8-phosphate synthase